MIDLSQLSSTELGPAGHGEGGRHRRGLRWGGWPIELRRPLSRDRRPCREMGPCRRYRISDTPLRSITLKAVSEHLPPSSFFSCSSEPSSSGHHTSMSGLRPIASSARFHFGFFEKSMTVLPALHRCCVAKNKTFSELIALLPRPNFNLWWLNGQSVIMPVWFINR